MAEALGPAVVRICTAGGFLGAHHERNERRTWLVVGVASAMMVAEIVGGSIFNSMALVADGWHMSTHAGALSVAAFLALRVRRRGLRRIHLTRSSSAGLSGDLCHTRAHEHVVEAGCFGR